MKYLFLILISVFTPLIGFATSFSEMKLNERVSSSDLIAVAKILQMRCLDKDGKPVAPLEKCTGPGMENKVFYNIVSVDSISSSSSSIST